MASIDEYHSHQFHQQAILNKINSKINKIFILPSAIETMATIDICQDKQLFDS
jgi:hypothetical protein